MSFAITKLSDLSLDAKGMKARFDKNYLEIIDRLHPNLPLRYKIDFVQKAALTGADPRLNQVHLTSYFSRKVGHEIGVTVFSYHFFLNQANQTGEYEGVDVNTALEDVFNPIKKENQKELVSTAIVYRKGHRPTTFKARWSECFNSKNPMWNERPYAMLEKTSIANALRWAFPEALSGMFIQEEINSQHIEEAEVISVKEKEEAIAVEKNEKSKEIISKAKNKSTKENLIDAIAEITAFVTKEMNKDAKIKYMHNILEVKSFNGLKSKTVKELTDLLEELEGAKEQKLSQPLEGVVLDG